MELDLSATVDWELRLVEAGLYTSADEGEGGGLMGSLEEAALRRFLRKREAVLREVATMTYKELRHRNVRNDRARRIEDKVLPTRFTKYSAEAVEVRARAGTYTEALRAVVGLELYRKLHGGYPESLEALTPACVETVPVDEYDSQPLRYSRKENTYNLYSVGPSGEDNGGHSKRDELIPPPVAKAFVASLHKSDE